MNMFLKVPSFWRILRRVVYCNITTSTSVVIMLEAGGDSVGVLGNITKGSSSCWKQSLNRNHATNLLLGPNKTIVAVN
jgi:hypothetical protein